MKPTSRSAAFDWVNGNSTQAGDFKRTPEGNQIRDPRDLLGGCLIKELDIEIDTVPGELVELINRR